MNTERPDNDDEARTAPGGAPDSGGASGHDGGTDAPEQREREPATPEPGTARPAGDAPGTGAGEAVAGTSEAGIPEPEADA
ncbi:hypothetical protein B7767_39115, partial [Streptomyces sp. 13-12-16]